MRAFFYLSVIASLAFPALVSAAPQPVANENDIVSRGTTAGEAYLQDAINALKTPCNAITSKPSPYWPDNVAELTVNLNSIHGIIQKYHDEVNSNHNVLSGLTQSSCSSLLGEIINLVVAVIEVVLGILSSCSSQDQIALKALLEALFALLGDLVCLVLKSVCVLLGGLLGIIVSLLVGLLGDIVTLLVGIVVDLSGCYVALPGCSSHWPTGLGGTYAITF